MENGAFLGEDYFEHLLAEIREIRLSERRFYPSTKGDGVNNNRITYTTDIEFTMVLKKRAPYDWGNTYTRIFMFDIVDGKYSTKSTLTYNGDIDQVSGHQELAQAFACEGCSCQITCKDYVNGDVEYYRTDGDVKSASYNSYLLSSHTQGTSVTYTEKGTLKADDYNRFYLNFE